MLAPVYFDDDFPIETDEIDDEILDGNLSTKFETDKTPVSQQAPHRRFGIGRASTHRFRKIAITLGNWPMLNSLRHRPLTRLGP